MRSPIIGDSLERYFATYLADLFELSAEQGYDSLDIVHKFTSIEYLNEMLHSVAVDYYMCGKYYTLNKFAAKYDFKKGNSFDPYVMWMYGYLLKWWAYRYPKDDVSKFPLEHFDKVFMYYHTLGWEQLIDEARDYCEFKEEREDMQFTKQIVAGIDVEELVGHLCDRSTNPYTWHKEINKVIEGYDKTKGTIIEQNKLVLLQACIRAYADKMYLYTYHGLEEDLKA